MQEAARTSQAQRTRLELIKPGGNQARFLLMLKHVSSPVIDQHKLPGGPQGLTRRLTSIELREGWISEDSLPPQQKFAISSDGHECR